MMDDNIKMHTVTSQLFSDGCVTRYKTFVLSKMTACKIVEITYCNCRPRNVSAKATDFAKILQ